LESRGFVKDPLLSFPSFFSSKKRKGQERRGMGPLTNPFPTPAKQPLYHIKSIGLKRVGKEGGFLLIIKKRAR
jgi:hypothetical protein